jgi:hypothetical protein
MRKTSGLLVLATTFSGLSCSDDKPAPNETRDSGASGAAAVAGSGGAAGSDGSGAARGSGGSSSQNATGGVSNAGGARSSGGVAGAGGAGGTSGSMNGSGGAGGAVSADGGPDGGHIDPFSGLVRKPDVDGTPVMDCEGQRDLTPCNVVTTPDRAYDICVQAMCVSPGCGDSSCNSPGPHFMMPPVFDHHYFERDAGDEPVVVDLVTGLYWQGCLAGFHGDDCSQGTATESTWTDAFTYCASLTWGGTDDWYLPDPYEVSSLYTLDDSGYRDKTRFPNATAPSWTSGRSSGSGPWRQGALLDKTYDDTAPVRCVRRGFSSPPDLRRFTRWAPVTSAPSEFIVRDAATNLDWQSCGSNCTSDGSPTALLYPDAVAYCENLAWAGYSDWRLPTAKEHLTTQNLRDATLILNYFAVFNRDGPYVQAFSGDPAQNPSPDVYDDEGGFTGPYPGKPYPTICVRWSG